MDRTHRPTLFVTAAAALIAGAAVAPFFPAVAAAATQSAGRPAAAGKQDPKAVALLGEVRKAYASLKALGYASTVIVTPQNRPAQRLEVILTVARPNRVALSLLSGGISGEATTVTSEGRTIYVYSPARKLYRKAAVRPGDDPAPLVAQFYALTAAPLLNAGYLFGPPAADESLALGGEETIARESCRLLVRSRTSTGERAEFWIAKRDNLPRRIRITFAREGVTFRAEETIRTLERNPKVSDDRFAFAPPKDARDAATVRDKPALLATGTPAADFSLPDQNNRAVKLSALKGKPVLLVFGGFPGPASNRALDFGLDLHQRTGRGKSIAVVAVNVGAKSNEQAAFLNANPRYNALPVLRDAGDASAVARKSYQVDRLPTVYLLDAKGKIVAAYAGFGDPVRQQLAAALKKEGIGG